MRRRTTHRWLRGYDFALNVFAVWRSDDLMPPDQLLRQTFEHCADFAAARRMLETTPVSRPAIYVLVGCAAGERCVIERTETGFVTRENDTSAANDWLPGRPSWEGRIGTRRFLTDSFVDAANYSRARRESLVGWTGTCAAPSFAWVREPVLNPYTRLAVAMCPARGVLRAIGYEATRRIAAAAGHGHVRGPDGGGAAAGLIGFRRALFARFHEVFTQRSAGYRKAPNCVDGHIFLAVARLDSHRLQLPEYGASHEHHNNDDLPDHAHLPLGSTQAAHHGMATAGAFSARARSFKRRNVARHRHHALRCAP